MWIKTQKGELINLAFVERVKIYDDRGGYIEHENMPYAVTTRSFSGKDDDVARFATYSDAEKMVNAICEKISENRHDAIMRVDGCELRNYLERK